MNLFGLFFHHHLAQFCVVAPGGAWLGYYPEAKDAALAFSRAPFATHGSVRVVCRRGYAADALYSVRRGSLDYDATLAAPGGPRRATLAVMGPGACVGDVEALEGLPRFLGTARAADRWRPRSLPCSAARRRCTWRATRGRATAASSRPRAG